MPNSKDFSVEDEAYLNVIGAEPKMTMDEVGADIDEHGHVPVTPETATQDPFSAKGSLSYAFDEVLANPTDDFRDETKGEVEGTNDTPQGLIQPTESNKEGGVSEPIVQQDKAIQVKDTLAEALDAITMDGAEEIEAKPPIGKDPESDLSKYNEEEASHIPLKAPKIPPSLGGAEDTPDANGLVYVSATFTVDPDKYVSNNYRPTNMGKMPDATAMLKQKGAALNSKPGANPEEESALPDLGTPEAKESAASPDEPTPQQEEAAAKDANKEQKEEMDVAVKEETASAIPTPKKVDKPAQDEAPEKVVLDYATFIDGSSFICFDEVADIDYSKIAMDAGPKKAPTRENCQTTFAQCRAKNPLYCRFHGPKLLEADIKTQIKAGVGSGCVVKVTKDKNSKNKFAFRLTVGCPPSKKEKVEYFIHMYMTQQPGISSSQEAMKDISPNGDTGLMTQEFEMDILQADKPPKTGKNDTLQKVAVYKTEGYKAKGMKQPIVGTTPSKIEKAASEEVVEKTKEGEEEEVIKSGQETTEETAAPEAPQEQAEEPKVEKPVSKPTASSVDQPSNDDEAEFDALVNEAEGNGLFNDDDFQKKYQEIFFDGKSDMAAKVAAMKNLMASSGNGSSSGNGADVDKDKLEEAFNDAIMEFPDDADGEAYSQNLELQNKFAKAYKADDVQGMKDAIEGMKKLSGGGSQTIVLPAPSAASSQTNQDEGGSSKKDEALAKVREDLKGAPAQSNGGNAISSLQNELSGLMDKMQSIGATTDADVFAMQHMCNYHMEDLNAAKSSLDEIEAKINSVSENSSGDSVADAMSMSMLEEAKKKAQDAVDENIAQMKGSIKQFTDSLRSYEKATMETAKTGAADSVEQTVKNLGLYIFGNKRPPQGVDSVTDYLDYKKDEMESAVEGASLSPDEMADIEDTYHLKETYDATKAASNAMDAAVAEFKDLMDSEPDQGDGYESYQREVTQAQKKVKAASVELMANFDAYKQALEKCKYEGDAAKKLAESKKKLESGDSQSPTGSVIKEDIEDFFDVDLSGESKKEALKTWLDLVNKGTFNGGSPKKLFEALGEWLQHKMEEKGVNHPVIQALVKAGLNLPNGMEQKAQGNQGGEEPKQSAQPSQQAQQKPTLTEEEKKAKIAAMSPKQKMSVAIQYLKKQIASNPSNKKELEEKLKKAEALFAKL